MPRLKGSITHDRGILVKKGIADGGGGGRLESTAKAKDAVERPDKIDRNTSAQG